jgi:16S rRNA (adenine1518-N6/adenine1519-N6)-dimethyltransferase
VGALSAFLVERSRVFTGIELDAGLYRVMSDTFGSMEKVHLIHGDALKVDSVDGVTSICSNLPYYCASEILFRLEELYPAVPLAAMMQKEMAQRLLAKPGTKEYGAMTVMLSVHYNMEIAFDVPHSAFYPRPDVLSSVVLFLPRKTLLKQGEREILSLVVKSAFWGRRKTLLKALSDSPHSSWSRKEAAFVLEKAEVDGNIRGEELSPGEFLSLAHVFMEKENEQ